jgi:hypothetical protein
MPNPWVSLRRDQLIPVNKVVNKKEQLEKGWRRRRKKEEFFDERRPGSEKKYPILLFTKTKRSTEYTLYMRAQKSQAWNCLKC